MSKIQQYQATGRRKSAVARVILRPASGEGQIIVNGVNGADYFDRPTLTMIVRQPLEVTSHENAFDVICNVVGGGKRGQAEAVRHGLSRALERYNPELRPALKHEGFMTRDSRVKERKKYGQKGARRRFQFSKR